MWVTDEGASADQARTKYTEKRGSPAFQGPRFRVRLLHLPVYAPCWRVLPKQHDVLNCRVGSGPAGSQHIHLPGEVGGHHSIAHIPQQAWAASEAGCKCAVRS